MWRVGQEHNVIRIVQNVQGRQQDGTGESTGRGSQREGMGESMGGEPIYGQGCLSRPGARLSKACGDRGGSCARIYDSNSIGDRAKEGRGSERRHAGTGEGISACIHVANSHGDRAEVSEGRRSNHRHSANSLWERVESCVLLVVGIVFCVSRARGVESLIIGCKAIQVKNADC